MRGNIVLADHGASVVTETVEPVPAPALFRPPAIVDGFAVGAPMPIPARFRPQLKSGPLVHAVPYDPANPPPSANAALATAPEDAVAFVTLSSTQSDQPPVTWTVERDLLQSDAEATVFVVETEFGRLGLAALRRRHLRATPGAWHPIYGAVPDRRSDRGQCCG